MAVDDYYRKLTKETDLPNALIAVGVGDYVRADIVRRLTKEQKSSFDMAVNFSKLKLSESEVGLSVLVSPLKRMTRRDVSSCEVKYFCESRGHRESSFLPMVDSPIEADVILRPGSDIDASDPGWIKSLVAQSDWKGFSRETRQIEMPGVEPITSGTPRVGVVVTVYNKPDRFVPCLESIKHETIYPLADADVVVVNDGSDGYSSKRIREYPFTILEHANEGYLLSVNRGIQKCFDGGCDLVVIVNSDVRVTRGWLASMVRCRLRTGAHLVNPLSNQQAAISVPLAGEKSWGFPRLPGRVSYIQAALYSSLIPPAYPDAVTNVGQCMMLTRFAWTKHGPFDEKLYGSGYGEECEMWASLRDDGHSCKVADDGYVYHESHGTHEQADEREKRGAELFIERWKPLYGRESRKIKLWGQRYRNLRSVSLTAKPDGCPVRFVAYNIGPYGGVACILRLVDELIGYGVNASVEHVINQDHTFKMLAGPNKHKDAISLRRLPLDPCTEGGIICATHWFTGEVLLDMHERAESFVPMAFWQDREDWFTEPDGRLSLRKSSIDVYPTIPNRIVNADWVGSTAVTDLGIEGYTHIPVGVDTEKFYPDTSKASGSVVRILSMYRPSTPRRGGKRLREVYSAIKKKYGDRVSVEVFGEESTFGDYNHGSLSQDRVAELMRAVDIVLEPSEYQGFGLPGLEALASGTAVVSTDNRGVHEYGIHGENCLIESDEISLEDHLGHLIENSEFRRRLGEQGRHDSMAFDWKVIGRRWFHELGRIYTGSAQNKYSSTF